MSWAAWGLQVLIALVADSKPTTNKKFIATNSHLKNAHRAINRGREKSHHRVQIDLPMSLHLPPKEQQTHELSLKRAMPGAICSHIISSVCSGSYCFCWRFSYLRLSQCFV